MTSGWPWAALFHAVSFSSVYENTDGWMLLARRKLSLIRWLSLELYTKQQTQREELRSSPPVQCFNNRRPQLNLRSRWVCFAVILWNSNLWLPTTKNRHLVRNIAWITEKFVHLKLIYPVHKLLNFLNWKQKITRIHCKKRWAIFPAPVGMSLTKLSLARNNWMSLAKLSLAGNN